MRFILLPRKLGLTCVSLLVAFSFDGRAQEAPDGAIVTALVRPGSSPHDNDAGEILACGSVSIEKKKGKQRFSVKANNLTGDSDLGVFIGTAATATNGITRFVNVLHNADPLTGRWTLKLEAKDGPPSQLEVDDVNSLAGNYVFVTDSSTNVLLRAFVPSLVPKLNLLKYSKHAKMLPADPAASPRARGYIRARFQARTGAATLEARGRRLAAGNSYCFYVVAFPDQPSEQCEGSEPLVAGRGSIRFESGRGEDLPLGVEAGVTRVQQLSGRYIEVRDVFGVTHLRGQIP